MFCADARSQLQSMSAAADGHVPLLCPIRLLGVVEYGDDDIQIYFSKELNIVEILYAERLIHSVCPSSLSIASVLAEVVGVAENLIQATDLRVYSDGSFTSPPSEADAELQQNFLLCDWGDYICDPIHFRVRLHVG